MRRCFRSYVNSANESLRVRLCHTQFPALPLCYLQVTSSAMYFALIDISATFAAVGSAQL